MKKRQHGHLRQVNLKPCVPVDRARLLAHQVKRDIEELVHESGADEVVILTITPSFADRVRSYELIAEAFGIGA